ncbi:hypothetical protein AB0H11_48540 [Streptomyces mirabilis]
MRTRDLTAEVRRVTDLGAAVLTGVRSARPAGHGTSWRIRTATISALWPLRASMIWISDLLARGRGGGTRG